MKIYLTRHGQTEWTVKNIICGRTDCDLTEEGIRQAQTLAENIKQLPINVVITSPLKRAKQTADILAKYIEKPCIVDKRLIERSYGIYEGDQRDDPAFLNALKELPGKLESGESVLEVAQRVFNFLDELKERALYETALLVGHGGVCGVVNAYFNDVTNEGIYGFNLENCGLAEYEL